MTDHHPENPDESERRSFLATAAMTGGLIAGYGTFGSMAGFYLYSQESTGGWQFLAVADELKLGDAFTYTAPSGAKVVVARQMEKGDADDFVALSSVCPHLGCQVHWESNRDRFFCPCHNGAFDRQGNALEGPPKAANQSLTRFPLKLENGLLYIFAPLKSVTESEEA